MEPTINLSIPSHHITKDTDFSSINETTSKHQAVEIKISKLSYQIFESLSNISKANLNTKLKFEGEVIKTRGNSDPGGETFTPEALEKFTTQLNNLIGDKNTPRSDLEIILSEIPKAITGLTLLKENYDSKRFFSFRTSSTPQIDKLKIELDKISSNISKELKQRDSLSKGLSDKGILAFVNSNKLNDKSVDEISNKFKFVGIFHVDHHLGSEVEKGKVEVKDLYANLYDTLYSLDNDLFSVDSKYELLAKVVFFSNEGQSNLLSDDLKINADSINTLTAELNTIANDDLIIYQDKKEMIHESLTSFFEEIDVKKNEMKINLQVEDFHYIERSSDQSETQPENPTEGCVNYLNTIGNYIYDNAPTLEVATKVLTAAAPFFTASPLGPLVGGLAILAQGMQKANEQSNAPEITLDVLSEFVKKGRVTDNILIVISNRLPTLSAAELNNFSLDFTDDQFKTLMTSISKKNAHVLNKLNIDALPLDKKTYITEVIINGLPTEQEKYDYILTAAAKATDVILTTGKEEEPKIADQQVEKKEPNPIAGTLKVETKEKTEGGGVNQEEKKT
ncbi:MAG: hypothetical protein H0W50_02915 [Parachlamydiaceae bacterium]|nr:hypothetical protein [Parachlamydiaceae bacterium]